MIIASGYKETVRERQFPMLFILSRADFIMKEAGRAGLIKANKSRLKTMSHSLLTYYNIV